MVLVVKYSYRRVATRDDVFVWSFGFGKNV
jgi:hypothetical protein